MSLHRREANLPWARQLLAARGPEAGVARHGHQTLGASRQSAGAGAQPSCSSKAGVETASAHSGHPCRGWTAISVRCAWQRSDAPGLRASKTGPLGRLAKGWAGLSPFALATQGLQRAPPGSTEPRSAVPGSAQHHSTRPGKQGTPGTCMARRDLGPMLDSALLASEQVPSQLRHPALSLWAGQRPPRRPARGRASSDTASRVTPSSCDTCALIAAACWASSSQLSRNTAAAARGTGASGDRAAARARACARSCACAAGTSGISAARLRRLNPCAWGVGRTAVAGARIRAAPQLVHAAADVLGEAAQAGREVADVLRQAHWGSARSGPLCPLQHRRAPQPRYSHWPATLPRVPGCARERALVCA